MINLRDIEFTEHHVDFGHWWCLAGRYERAQLDLRTAVRFRVQPNTRPPEPVVQWLKTTIQLALNDKYEAP